MSSQIEFELAVPDPPRRALELKGTDVRLLSASSNPEKSATGTPGDHRSQ